MQRDHKKLVFITLSLSCNGRTVDAGCRGHTGHELVGPIVDDFGALLGSRERLSFRCDGFVFISREEASNFHKNKEQ